MRATTTGNAAPMPANTITSTMTHTSRLVCGLKYVKDAPHQFTVCVLAVVFFVV